MPTSRVAAMKPALRFRPAAESLLGTVLLFAGFVELITSPLLGILVVLTAMGFLLELFAKIRSIHAKRSLKRCA